MNTNYSGSFLVNYSDGEVDGNAGNTVVDHMIEILSEVERRLSQNSNKAPATDGRNDDKQALRMATETAEPNALTGVNNDAVIVVTERTSTGEATAVQNARNARTKACGNCKAYLRDETGRETHVSLSSTTPTAVKKNQSEELQHRELEQEQQQKATEPDIK